MAERLMAVHAHPDDESSKGAATTAYYVARGAEVMVVTCTGGERGTVLNASYPAQIDSMEQMKAVRRAEMAAAQAVLGVRHEWLGFVDSGLPEGDPLPPLPVGSFATLPLKSAAEPLVKLIRSFRPHVLTTYDPSGGYPHPDHIMTHTVSMFAVEAAAAASQFPHAGKPWRVQKVYYNHGFSIARMRTVHAEMQRRHLPSPFSDWLESRMAREIPEREVTTRVVVSDFFDKRDEALRAHATQVDPQGWFFAVPRDVELAVWPTEEYELASAMVAVSLPEDDLFAGIETEAQ